MSQTPFQHTYAFSVDALNSKKRDHRLRELITHCVKDAPGVQRLELDTLARTLTILSSEPLDIDAIKTALATQGFHLQPRQQTDHQTVTVCIDGMTCQSCEMLIERKWQKLPGVARVDVSAVTGQATITCTGVTPSLPTLQQSLGSEKYIVSTSGSFAKKSRPTVMRLLGLFALVFLLAELVSRLGLFQTSFTVSSGMSFGAILLVGLVAASSSCVAVVGGLLLSSAAKFNERYAAATPLGRMRPVLLFVTGRVVGYAVLGGLLGVVGKALTPSPLVTAIITIIAALYMLVMGLDMLNLAPAWLKRLTPRLPKSLSSRVMDADGHEHPLAPFALGAATFFLPCGFTQALQLYALTTGSFVTAASSLLAFALGTAPALLVLGWASSSLKGKLGRFFFQFSGALVIVLGLWNVQNGLTIAGYPLSLPTITFSPPGAGAEAGPTVSNGQQVIRMTVNRDGYSPGRLTIKAGLPTRWEIEGTGAAGCASVLQSRSLGIQQIISPGQNTITFTAPTQPGTYPFSCSMGMYRGEIVVVP